MAEVEIVLKATRNTAHLYYVNPGGTVDDVYTFNSSDGNKLTIIDTIGPYLARAGGILPGSNMLSRVQTILDTSSVTEIIFDGGDITLTGTLSCAGKKLTLINGARFIGVHTLEDAVLNIELDKAAFTLNTTMVNCRTSSVYFTMENFGSPGTGAGDDTSIFQKVADTLIANPKMARIIKLLPGRKYVTSGTIFHNWNGTDYDQFSLVIQGNANGFGGNPYFCSTIQCTNLNGFGVAIQRATGFTIQGINFEGSLVIPNAESEWGDYYLRDYTTYASDHGARDSRYSPNCLLGIDLFRNVVSIPEDGGYPGYSAWYRGSGSGINGGSTAVTVKDCTFNGATIGIANSPNGQSQQAENFIFSGIHGYNMKSLFAFCQRESKGCIIEKVYCTDRVYNAIDGNNYGAQAGTIPACSRVNMSGTCVQFIQASTQHSVTFRDIYMESQWRIGDMHASAGTISWQDCTLNLNAFSAGDDGTGNSILAMPYTHFKGDGNHFINCNIRYYDDLFNKRMIFEGNKNMFTNCFFDLPPVGFTGRPKEGTNRPPIMNFYECKYGNGGTNTIGAKSLIGQVSDVLTYNAAYGRFNYENQNPSAPPYYMNAEYNCGAHETFTLFVTTSTFVVDTATRTCTIPFDSTIIGNIGDVVLIKVPGPDAMQYLGRISGYDGSSMTLSDVPIGYPEGDLAVDYAGVSRLSRLQGRYVGDYTSGSNTITNVWGEPYGGIDSATGYVITAVAGDMSWGTGTITMKGNAGSNLTQHYTDEYRLPDKVVKTYYRGILPEVSGGTAGDPTKYFPGDIWWVSSSISYVCKTAGFINAASLGYSKQSTWKQVVKNEVGETVLVLSDYVILEEDSTLLVDTSEVGDITITYPVTLSKKPRVIKKVSSDAGLVIVSPSAGTIDGNASSEITFQYELIRVQPTGTNLLIV